MFFSGTVSLTGNRKTVYNTCIPFLEPPSGEKETNILLEEQKMKKIAALVLALVLALSVTAALADGITIAIPNDATNEGRALLLLQAQGLIKLKEDAGITATVADIEESNKKIEAALALLEK